MLFRSRTTWRIRQIEQQGRELHVLVDDAGGIYWRDRLDKVAAVLHRDAPGDVDRFVIRYRVDGITDTEHVIERDMWAMPFTRPILPREQISSISVRRAPGRPAESTTLYDASRPRSEASLGLGYQQVLGGPDAFFLYQVSAVESFAYRFREDT